MGELLFRENRHYPQPVFLTFSGCKGKTKRIAEHARLYVEITTLLRKANDCIGLITSDTVIFEQGKADLLAVYSKEL